ncbi:MAG: 23S rRNA (pseudouridine(1915)-N(3))-methyltransferase RlmH [Helicobacter sp.]|nr:23S rRNA (pseudouridine(1915)-N(3))-methyltransferase RlmH [Helicobacter sp.]
MIKVIVYYIAKDTLSSQICEEYMRLVSHFRVKLEFINMFCKNIKEGQKNNENEAKRAYTQEFLKVFKEASYKVALTPQGRSLDSFGFAEVLKDKAEIVFFIGGAYGLEQGFLHKCNLCVSLSSLTFSHSIARIVLSEQIYRGFCLLNNHPYHK